MASCIEETLNASSTGQGQRDAACKAWLHYAVDQLENYLDSLLADDGCDRAIVTDTVQAFRRFKGLPAAEDAAAVAAVLAGEAATRCDAEPEAAVSATPTLPRQQDETTSGATLAALLSSIDADVRHVYGQGAASAAPGETIDRTDQADRYVLFTLAGSRYAVSVPHVLEIGPVLPITPVPNVPTWVRGIMNLRGDILSVINMRTLLGVAETHQGAQNRLLVVKAVGDELMTSLMVDQVMGIVSLAPTDLDTPTALAHDKAAPYLTGVYEHEGQVCAVFDLERFLLSPEVRQFE
jgi:purine-binding chemotaxis protein CheW